MATDSELRSAIQELLLRPDIVWLATRLRSDPEDERSAWPRRIDIHIRFFRSLLRAGLMNGVTVDLVSHGRSGRAVPRLVRNRAFIEWDFEAESASAIGTWRAFAIFALVPDDGGSRVWCWICESVEEEEYAESLFAWWEPQSFAYARGLPLFPERISSFS